MGWKVPHGVREADLLRALRHPSASGLRPWTPGILALSEILDFGRFCLFGFQPFANLWPSFLKTLKHIWSQTQLRYSRERALKILAGFGKFGNFGRQGARPQGFLFSVDVALRIAGPF